MTTRRQTTVICLLLAVHAVLDLVLLDGGWELYGTWDLFLLAWPLSQGSLIALWAALSRIRSFLRLPAALLGIVWTWLLTVRVLDFPVRGEESAGWAAMFAVQALGLVIVTTAGRLIRYLIQRNGWLVVSRRLTPARSAGGSLCSTPASPSTDLPGALAARQGGATDADSRPLQFSLRLLLLWMTLLALMLGLGSTAFQWLGWTREVLRWQYFYLCPVLGAGNAVFALIVLASLAGQARLLGRVLLATTLVGTLGYGHWYVLVLLFRNTGSVTATDLALLAVYQALYLYVTLLPLYWAGCVWGERIGGTPCRP